MNPRKFALYGGSLMLLIGVVAMIPSLVGPTNALPALKLETSYGAFLNMFAMNIVNKVVLVLFGIAGIWAANLPATSLPRSILFSRAVFFVMGIGALLGFFPQTNTLYGYWPLFGYDAFMHLAFAVIGLYFGYALSYKVETRIKQDPNLKTVMQGH